MAGAGEFEGELFKGVVKEVADMADGEAGAGGDVFVGKAVVEFKLDDLAGAGVEAVKDEAGKAGGFVALDLGVGERGGVGNGVELGKRRGVRGGRCGRFEGDGAAGGAVVGDGEVVDGAVKPGGGLADFASDKARVEAQEGFLHAVLGGFGLAGEAHGIREEGRLQGAEELFQRAWWRGLGGSSLGLGSGLHAEWARVGWPLIVWPDEVALRG